MKIEITKDSPPVISWHDKNRWVKREPLTRKALKEHGIKHSFFLSVLLHAADILCK